MSTRKLNLSGSLLGVDFSVSVTEAGEDTVQVAGTAGGQPVQLYARLGDDFISVSGSLLGRPCSLTSSQGA